MQRKRHINFKFWKVVESSTSTTKVQKPYLHSIPILSSSLSSQDDNNSMKNKVKSNVLYSIPCSCVLALLLVGAVSLLLNQSCSAIASASLSITTPSMSTTTVQGSSATVSTKVNVSVSDVNDYSLTLKVDNANLTNGSTVIKPGNAINDNTWGYKWDKDNTSTYKAPTTTGTNLTVPTLTNNSANFEGILTFGAKFAANADAGHYRGSGTLSLVATPKATAKVGEWLLPNGATIVSGITKMQEIKSGFCQNNSAIPVPAAGATSAASIVLLDSRNNKEYRIAKLQDGKCWMTDNLRLELQVNTTLTTANTNITTNWVPTENTMFGKDSDVLSSTDFTGSSRAQSYAVSNDSDVYYYSWKAAVAGSTSSGNVNTDICPKGWNLPNYSTNSNSDFHSMINSAGIANNATGSALLRGEPYNFNYTGYVAQGVIKNATSEGYWYTNNLPGSNAWRIYVGAGSVSTSAISSTYGAAIRCMAKY